MPRILPEMILSRSVAMQWLVVAVALFVLLYLLAPILAPFVAAAILAYICEPLVARMCAWKVPRTLAVLLTMLAIALLALALLLVMLPLLQQEWAHLVARIPQWLDSARQHVLPALQQWSGTSLQWDNEAIRQQILGQLQGAGGVAAQIIPWLGDSGGTLLALFANLLLIPLAMFYLLRDWNEILVRIDTLIPRHWHEAAHSITTEIDRVLAEFLRGQIAVMLLMSVFYSIALWLVGLEFALPIGLIAGLLVFVPYLGMVLGLLLATLAAVMQFPVWGDVLWVWGVFATGQLLEGMLITPWLIGDRIGLHPLAVIFALLAFGQLFGFFGLLLALPLAAALLVVLRHVRGRYLASEMYIKP
ncbi:MAG: AI-2E family transporter [Sideroxydans sp.]|jgi:predicted PurR-regulated permease PerM